MHQRSPRGGITPALAEIATSARRIIAAECCAFLRDADTKSEAWQPYVDWASDLRNTDTIITFNYDRVLEILGPKQLEVLLPRAEGEDDLGKILKLHGSVDWKRQSTGQSLSFTQVKDSPEFAVDCGSDELSIATPGPTKKETAGELGHLWRVAERSLREADAIVFVGYRFPPSDAEARGRLLRAIEHNKQASLAVHIVLGADTGHRDVKRLEHLVRSIADRAGRAATAIGFRCTVHPLFAEDFFTVWARDSLAQ